MTGITKFLIILVILLVILVGFFVWAMTIPTISSEGEYSNYKNDYSNNVINDEKKCHEEKIPYDSIETYEYHLESEKVSFDTERKMEVLGRGTYSYAIAELKNIDDEAGWFTLTFTWETLKDGEHQVEVRHFIEPDEIIEFEAEYDIDISEDYEVGANYISDPIEKTRTVVKYRYETVCK